MQSPTVSIIMPSYNRAHLIEKGISSVLNQNYRNWELIIVDDGSTDETGEVIKRFQQDERVYYFHIDNGGVSRARNYGISKSKGEYILFLDSDDEIEKGKLEKHMELFASETNLNVTVSQVIRKKIETGKIKKHSIIKPIKNLQSEFIRKKLAWKIHSPIWEKKFLLEENGFNEFLKSSEDFEFYARLVLRQPKVGYVHEFLSIINDYDIEKDRVKLRTGKNNLPSLKNHLLSRNLIGFNTYKSNLENIHKINIYLILLRHWFYCFKEVLIFSPKSFFNVLQWYFMKSMPLSYKMRIK